MNKQQPDAVELSNRRPAAENITLLTVILVSGVAAIWWGLTIATLEPALTALVGVSGSVLWCLLAVGAIKRAVAADGVLTLYPTQRKFRLNKKTYPYEALNFYSSSLVAPKLVHVYFSSQHLVLGVGKNRYKISDDIAVSNFTPEQLEALGTLINESNLTSEDKASFKNWSDRVQVVGNHAAQAVEGQ